MSIPILGAGQSGVCVVCKGELTPDHEHIYVDKRQLAYMDQLLLLMVENNCLIPTTEGMFPAHPQLEPTYMWFPVKITHLGAHEECKITFPHHHCEVDHDVSGATEAP